MSVAYAPEPPKRRPSPRQAQVLALFNQGRSAKEIALELGMLPQTVYVHLSRLQRGGFCVARSSPKRRHPPRERVAMEPAESPQSRIDRDIAAGTRCARCWLLKPCDHE